MCSYYNNYRTGYRGSIYLANIDNDGKIEKGLCVGKVFALSNDERYKSRAYPDMEDLIFEEFTTANFYLKNEVKRLMQLVSTIFRRRKGYVWMIANTISRISPYFNEWALSNVYTMQQGQIDLYNLKNDDGSITKIAVEYCANSGDKKSNMFFGKFSKNIDSGSWEVDEYPHLPCEYNDKDNFRMLRQYLPFAYGGMYNDRHREKTRIAKRISYCIGCNFLRGGRQSYISARKKETKRKRR